MSPVKYALLVFCEEFNWASGRDKDQGIRKIRDQLSEIRGQKMQIKSASCSATPR